jgi:hypothetical protein
MLNCSGRLTSPTGLVSISPFSPCSIQSSYYNIIGIPASQTVPAANRAIIYPFRLTAPILVQQLWCFNGAVVAGNIDIGIYSEDMTRLVSTGAIAQAGINQAQVFNIADILIGPGIFFLAFSCSDAAARLFRGFTDGTAITRLFGVYIMNAAHPLPATFVPAINNNSNVYLFGITARSVF